MPAVTWISSVGSAIAMVVPTMTEPAFRSTVAPVMATSTVAARYRVAKANDINWLLSPISARKMTTKERTNASMTGRGAATRP